ncbi:MAG: C-GCAxxG-C-C family protein [Spirochaetaceae bacterium]
MKKIKNSIELFVGSAKKKRLNCAEAISHIFHHDISPMSDKDLKQFKKYGHGRAPGKVCGAYYAAEYLLEKARPEVLGSFQETFKEEAGSLNCKEILKKKVLSCEGCVNITAQFLNNISE